MLKKFSNSRTLADNMRLGSLTAFSAGMVNVTSIFIFFAFTSNVTGHYAILAQEIAKGNWYQAAVVFLWIGLFFFGNFTSNLFIINNHSLRGRYLAHAIPLILEILCLLFVGIYLEYYYSDTLKETEIMVGTMLFAMGLQNGLTASISNSTVKTTHLTGLTTDLGILFSMLTKKEYRESIEVKAKTKLLLTIMISYMTGGVTAGLVYLYVGNFVFYAVSIVLGIVILYDFYKLQISNFLFWRRRRAIQEAYANRRPVKKGEPLLREV